MSESYKGIFYRVFSKTLEKTGLEALKKTSMFGQSNRAN